MKNKALLLTIALTCATALTSCQTTGDPRQGGLFGWSEPKAQDRLNQRQGTLDAINYDTNQQRARGNRLQSQYNSLR
jgi:hypothetical protein